MSSLLLRCTTCHEGPGRQAGRWQLGGRQQVMQADRQRQRLGRTRLRQLPTNQPASQVHSRTSRKKMSMVPGVAPGWGGAAQSQRSMPLQAAHSRRLACCLPPPATRTRVVQRHRHGVVGQLQARHLVGGAHLHGRKTGPRAVNLAVGGGGDAVQAGGGALPQHLTWCCQRPPLSRSRLAGLLRSSRGVEALALATSPRPCCMGRRGGARNLQAGKRRQRRRRAGGAGLGPWSWVPTLPLASPDRSVARSKAHKQQRSTIIATQCRTCRS